MNIALVYDDGPRYWTVGSYVNKVLVNQDEKNVVCHCRIPEDTGLLEEQCGHDIDLAIVVDSSTHYKLHHHKGKFSEKTKTVFWVSDLHRDDWAAHRLQMMREWHYDHIFYAQKNFKDKVLACGYTEEECTWLPHAADASIFRPLPWITKRYDIGYVGYANEKRKSIETTLSDYMDFKHYSSVWAWAANRCMSELKIGLNVSVEDDVCNMRTFETLACGLPLLINKVEGNGLEEILTNDMYLAFENDEELKEFAVRLIASKELREQMGKAGREHILTNHTYRNRVNTILATFDFELLSTPSDMVSHGL